MSAIALLASAVVSSFALATPVGSDVTTEAPHFVLLDRGDAAPSVDALPLKATAAHIDVAGVIAHVTLE